MKHAVYVAILIYKLPVLRPRYIDFVPQIPRTKHVLFPTHSPELIIITVTCN